MAESQDQYLCRLNIENFRRRIATATSEADRKILRALLAEASAAGLHADMVALTDYQLHFLHALGHVAQSLDIICDTDEHAIAMSLTNSDGRAMELWQAKRWVRNFEATPHGPRGM
jgi:hypothetical protein